MPFNRKDHNELGELRPRFHLLSSFDHEEVLKKLHSFTLDDHTVDGRKAANLYYLDIPESQRHFWSPELMMSFEKYNDDKFKTRIRVLVGPQYSVWIRFVFMYSALGLLTLFGGMYGLTQFTLGIKSGWVWCLPISVTLLIGVYVIAKLGQKKGRDHTLHLVSCLYHSLGEGELERIDSN